MELRAEGVLDNVPEVDNHQETPPLSEEVVNMAVPAHPVGPGLSELRVENIDRSSRSAGWGGVPLERLTLISAAGADHEPTQPQDLDGGFGVGGPEAVARIDMLLEVGAARASEGTALRIRLVHRRYQDYLVVRREAPDMGRVRERNPKVSGTATPALQGHGHVTPHYR